MLKTIRADIESVDQITGGGFDLIIFSNVLNELFPFDEDRIARNIHFEKLMPGAIVSFEGLHDEGIGSRSGNQPGSLFTNTYNRSNISAERLKKRKSLRLFSFVTFVLFGHYLKSRNYRLHRLQFLPSFVRLSQFFLHRLKPCLVLGDFISAFAIEVRVCH